LLFNFLFSRQPYIAERFNFREYREALSELLSKESFDLIQLEGPYPGHYLPVIRKWSKAKVALRAHNVEHLIWKRKAVNEKISLKRWYIKNMASRLERFEMDMVHQSDYVIPISPQDKVYFRNRGYVKPVLTIPAGLTLDEYPITPLPSAPSLLFIGALDWLPNQEGLNWFLDHVFDNLVAQLPQIQLHVAGRNAPDHFARKLQHDHIVYHGEVDDSRKFMQAYRIMVAPLLTGSGIRIKILEGMALGRPVVTTSVGIEGIPARNNREVRIADDPDQFKKQVVTMLSDDTAVNSQVKEARDLIKENFDTFGLSTRLSQFFNEQV